ncbi:MAG: class II fructose-bisphosphate aldolase [Lachnospiraceae bacterium]|nr:class II fructose-bisphosphate aldolase [Lachnospiraceae bacterium]
MLVNAKDLLMRAKEQHYAIPSANFVDEDSLRCHLRVAEKLGMPIIMAHAEAHQNRYLSIEEAAELVRFYAKNAEIPVVLHLDHGQSLEMAERAVRCGFTSVMLDASMETFDENVRRTKEVVKFAHGFDVSVEAEIGHVGTGEKYTEDSDTIYTSVQEAADFVKFTDVDSLAVSIGTAHGLYKGTPKISFERLHEIAEAVSVPLVLHGGSSSGDENLHRCATEGIAKINIYSDFMVWAAKRAAAFSSENADLFANDGIGVEDYYRFKDALKAGMEECLTHYYEVFATKTFADV